MRTFRFRVLATGCRLNQAECEEARRRLHGLGGQETDDGPTDLCVVNTCAVTAKAERKSLSLVRRLLRESPPTGRVVVTGCLADLGPERLARLAPRVLVLPQAAKRAWLERGGRPDGSLPGRSRPFIIIQSGCDGVCSFCVVRRLRGPSRSRPFAAIAADAERLAALGYAEAVLTATDAASYDADGLDLSGLLRSLGRLGLPLRYRLPSLEPGRIDPDAPTIDAFGLDCVCDHFHLCVQSGDPATLRRMRRDSDPAKILRLVRRIRSLRPHAAIGADIIVGFPGETEESFRRTLDLVEEMRPAYLHVFPFSPRPGTEAAELPDRPSAAETGERHSRAVALSSELWRRFVRTQSGRRLVFVVEQTRLLSSNYIPARPAPGLSLPRRGAAVEAVLSVEGDAIRAEPTSHRGER